MKSILLGAFALMAAGASAAWTFDRSTMTATDGSWTVTFVADGENLGIKTVTGSGDLDFTTFYADTGVKITKSVTYNGNAGGTGTKAFSRRNFITSVKAPDLITVGYSEFWQCSALTNAYLPSARKFGDWCFNECKKLESLTISPDTVALPSDFSNGNPLLKELLPAELTALETIGSNAFRDCKKFASTLYCPNLTNIAQSAFLNCFMFEGIHFPKIKSIGQGAFSDSRSLKKITPFLPDSLTVINGSIFWRGSTVLSFVQEEPLRIANSSITKIGSYAFTGVTTKFTMPVHIYSPVANIAQDAFTPCVKGQEFNFYSDVVPSFGLRGIHTAGAGRVVFKIHSASALTAWRTACETYANKFESWMAQADYPGKKTVGVIDCSNGQGTYAWVIDATASGGTMMMVR